MIDIKNDTEVFRSRIDSNNILDFSFLNNIQPYNSDIKLNTRNENIQEEIQKLTNEINSIDIKPIPFDKWDYIVAFTIGILEVAGDFFISDHNNENSIGNKMSDKNSKLGGLFEQIHKNLDHSGQPLDYQGYKFGGGDHRGRTFGHDLIMFPLAIYMLCSGRFIDGYYEDGIFKFVMSQLNQYGNEYNKLSFDEAVIAYLVHMVADFFSAKGLPIPGFGLLAHFPQRNIRKFVNDLYKDGLNLRNLVMQGVPVATTELLIWIYNSLRYKDSEFSKEVINNKKEKLLLISHGIATAVNSGKVIITKKPTSLNLVMIIRTIKLVWKVVKDEANINNKVKEKVNLSVLKNKLETMDTLILLNDAVYYTTQIDKLIVESNNTFKNKFDKRQKYLSDSFEDIDDMLDQLKTLNN